MNQTQATTETKSDREAKRFRLYKLIALAVLFAFLLGGLVFFDNDITVENLRYLVKYLDFSSVGGYSDGTKIHYNADSTNCFYVFRGDLAIVSDGGVNLYDRRGSVVMTDAYSMSNPVAVCGDKYLIVYDLGGYQVRVYNSFSLLHERSFDYPIQSVSQNTAGDFCVVSSEKSYHSAVFVYNNDFKEVKRWFSTDKFATDATLTDQNRLTVSTVKVSDGELKTEWIDLSLKEEESIHSYSVSETFPLAMVSDRQGSLVLTDTSLIRVEEGKAVRSVPVSEDGLRKAVFGEEICALLQDEFSVGINFKLSVYNLKGEALWQENFSVQIRQIEVFEDTVYVLTHTDLVVISAKGEKKTYSLGEDYAHFGVLDSDHVIFCSDTVGVVRTLD